MDAAVTTTIEMIAQGSVPNAQIPTLVPILMNHGEKPEKFNELNF